MSVDAAWLESVRQKNRKAVGMAGMHGLGYEPSEVIAQKASAGREQRTESIHAGRFTPAPAEGTAESLARAIGPVNVPAPAPVPPGLTTVLGVAVAGLGAYVIYKLVRG